MLHTERLRLRPPTIEDVDALVTWQSLPEVCTYLPYAPRTREEVAAKIGTYDGGHWLLERLDGSPIGEFMLFRSDAELDLGYVLHPSAWGAGYATEAAGAVLAWAWEAYDDDHIVAIIDPENGASRRVLERLGFDETGSGTDPLGPFVRFELSRPA
jgi:RimJ/RimL family protein N-acetyltransferase